MPVLPMIALLLLSWASGLGPARAGDAPPPAVARDLEILNRLRQLRKTTAPVRAQPPATAPPAPQLAPPPATPVPAAQPEGDPDAARIAGLIAGLGDPAKGAREEARRILVKIGAPAVPDLILALDDAETRVRIEAAEALGAIRDPRAAEPLAGLLGDPSKELWGAVSRAFAGIGSPAVPALLDALSETDQTARRRAVHALGRIRDPGSAESLIALLNKDRSTGVRVEIAAALGKIRDRAACDALLDALHDW